MKPVDRIIIGVVILAVALAAFFAVRRKKHRGCCGDCSCCLGRECGDKKTADK